MKRFPLLGVYGGTFDPVHNGHIQPLEQVTSELAMQHVRVLPCHIPPHKATPSVSSQDRLEMVRLACKHNARLIVDDRELRRNNASYTVDTLFQLRREFPDHALCFIMGTDSLNHFTQWHRWQDILSLAHLVVCSREVRATPSDMPSALNKRLVTTPNALHQQQAGLIWRAVTDLVSVSSTQLRDRLKQDGDTSDRLSPEVRNYINTHQLYRT